MTSQASEVVQLVGCARAGDPVTATAVAWHAERTRQGRPSRVAAVEPGTIPDMKRFDPASSGELVVHTVDGGEDLSTTVGALGARRLTVVHHGSAVGSDRRSLRALRGCTDRAVAADPAAREELRGLGFRRVDLVDPGSGHDAFADTVPDASTASNLARHPGALLLWVGPVGPNRGVELLLRAFAEVVTHTVPSAVLSLCGPAAPWYRARLHREVTARGLLACEVVVPRDDSEVLARLERADAVVCLRPAALDPYVLAAARRGVPIVAPADARTVWIDRAQLVPLGLHPSSGEVATAITRALT
jgi:glycosyltransferase involved in cell wall biosynthesis